MAAILDFQDGRHCKPTFAYNSRTKHARKKNSTGIFKFTVSEFKQIIFKIPRWRPSWIFKMAAIDKPTFAYNSRTKHDRKKNSTGIFKFRINEFN